MTIGKHDKTPWATFLAKSLSAGNSQAATSSIRSGAHNSVHRVATGLLLAMAALYVASRFYELSHPAIGFVRAFAEAAMVGALADWFAVTALFRRPLGLPIPHTAVVPRNKDRIGKALAEFVERHFLAPGPVRGRIAGIDFAAALCDWLARPEQRRRLAMRAVNIVSGVLNALKDEDLRRFLREDITERLRTIDIAPLAANLLTVLISENRHQALVDEMVVQAERLLKEYEPALREKVRQRTSWLWKKLSLDEKVADQIVMVAEEALHEVNQEPSHPWRQQFDQAIRAFILELETAEEYRLMLEQLKHRILDDPALQQYFSSLWDELKAAMLRDAASPDPVMRARLEAAIAELAAVLKQDDQTQKKINQWVRVTILRVTASQRHEIGRLISDTIRCWSAESVGEKIAAQVGDDLQYIRINGTLIGGLVGVVIHSVSIFVF
jgi:uncharacterized membrane-anchored protein YjiN (DUF445 family)